MCGGLSDITESCLPGGEVGREGSEGGKKSERPGGTRKVRGRSLTETGWKKRASVGPSQAERAPVERTGRTCGGGGGFEVASPPPRPLSFFFGVSASFCPGHGEPRVSGAAGTTG